jgi:hypothetical protein
MVTGVDEEDLDANGQPAEVAIKLMRMKSHFVRECEARKLNFSVEHVVNIKQRIPATDDELNDWPEHAELDVTGKVTLNKVMYSWMDGWML